MIVSCGDFTLYGVSHNGSASEFNLTRTAGAYEYEFDVDFTFRLCL